MDVHDPDSIVKLKENIDPQPKVAFSFYKCKFNRVP